MKHPGVTSFAIIALTLGIGATTTMFSIVYGALIKGLPYDNADRILEVQRAMISKRMDRMGMPLGEYYEYRDQQHSFAIFAAETDGIPMRSIRLEIMLRCTARMRSALSYGRPLMSAP